MCVCEEQRKPAKQISRKSRTFKGQRVPTPANPTGYGGQCLPSACPARHHIPHILTQPCYGRQSFLRPPTIHCMGAPCKTHCSPAAPSPALVFTNRDFLLLTRRPVLEVGWIPRRRSSQATAGCPSFCWFSIGGSTCQSGELMWVMRGPCPVFRLLQAALMPDTGCVAGHTHERAPRYGAS